MPGNETLFTFYFIMLPFGLRKCADRQYICVQQMVRQQRYYAAVQRGE